MLKVTKRTDYGLTIMTALAANPDEFQSLMSLSKKYVLPYKFIGQIAGQLLDAELVVSKEGAGGGYKLAKEAKDISLHDVTRVLEGPVISLACFHGKKCPRKTACVHRAAMEKLGNVVEESLMKISLADVVHNRNL